VGWVVNDQRDVLERAVDFACLELPGQPKFMHMGTSYLVKDLAKEVRDLRDQKAELLSALRAVFAEVTPGERPYSSDSYLPENIVVQVRSAIEKTERQA
jgi:hypothetical protein